MFSTSAVAVLIVLAAGTLTAYAAPDSSQRTGASIDARHQHLRDAKQGPAASIVSPIGQPSKKLLHDHRDMK